MTIGTVVNKSNAIRAAVGTGAVVLAQRLTSSSAGWIQGLAMFGALLVSVPLVNSYIK